MSTIKDQQQQDIQISSPQQGKSFLDIFKEPPAAEKIECRETVKKTYAHWRLRIFVAVFIAYSVFYLCKKNLSAALPAMTTELGYTNTELGILGSSLYFTYAIGKFVNGVIADSANVRTFLPAALVVSAIANICIVISSLLITPGEFTFFGMPAATVLLWVMAFFWGCNGWFQSMGFPNVAKTLTYWYSNNERGTKWALWSTSHQTGTFFSVIISGFVIAQLGWKAAFYVPASIAAVVAIFLYQNLRDKPTSMGLPDIEEYREPHVCREKEKAEEDNTTYLEIFKKHILFNKTMWLLACAYIFVYIIRFGTEDWIIKYLVEAKQNSLETAVMKLSVLPLFGIAGTIGAGYFSDTIFKGKRAPINIIFLSGIVLSLLGLKYNNISALDYVFIGLAGMFTYGPQMLIGGLCAVESSSKKVASAATGFTGSFGYLGAILSGLGTGYVIDNFGWNGALWFWILSAVACIAICIPMWEKDKDETC